MTQNRSRQSPELFCQYDSIIAYPVIGLLADQCGNHEAKRRPTPVRTLPQRQCNLSWMSFWEQQDWSHQRRPTGSLLPLPLHSTDRKISDWSVLSWNLPLAPASQLFIITLLLLLLGLSFIHVFLFRYQVEMWNKSLWILKKSHGQSALSQFPFENQVSWIMSAEAHNELIPFNLSMAKYYLYHPGFVHGKEKSINNNINKKKKILKAVRNHNPGKKKKIRGAK